MFNSLSYKLKIKQSHKTLTIDKKLVEGVRRQTHELSFVSQIMERAWLIFNTTMPIFRQSKLIH